jgi:hypothetical protein
LRRPRWGRRGGVEGSTFFLEGDPEIDCVIAAHPQRCMKEAVGFGRIDASEETASEDSAAVE